MGQKNNVMCDYLEKPDKFADFINGSLYQGREVVKAEQVEESPTVYSREGRARDVLKKVCNGGSYLLIGIHCFLSWDRGIRRLQNAARYGEF